MKIAVTSDTHWHPCPFPDADFFIHCGDLTGHGNLAEAGMFAQRLNASSYEGGIIVPGNHDWIFQQNPDLVRELFHSRFAVLIDQAHSWRGLSFWGSPWTPPFMNWAFMKTEPELEQVYSQIPAEVDFLITHGPPRGICDGDHLGSKALRLAVTNYAQHKIGRHVFGHIHEAGGQSFRHAIGTEFSNVSACNLKYEMVNPPLILDLP